MGVRVFRGDSWARIKSGDITRRDIMGLNPRADGELIAYLLLHAPRPRQQSLMKYASAKYGIAEAPTPRRNIDDPHDARYEEYVVLQEQVDREDDYDALRAAALHSSDHDVAAFAFCRITGYHFPPSDCDAYSYRTFGCAALPNVTAQDIRQLCQAILAEGGPLTDAAKECLRNGPEPSASRELP